VQDTAEIKSALQNPETSATLLNAILTRQYGEEWLAWEPLTVYLEIKSDYRVDPPSELLDRIAAIQIIMTSDAFFKRLDAFIAICTTLSTGDPSFAAFDPASVEECAWGIAEVGLLREPLPFSYAIQQYLKQLLGDDGYTSMNYPETIKTAFDSTPTSLEIKQTLAGDHNKGVVEQYVNENLKDLIYQFNQIPSMSNIDDFIFREVKGLEV
jgi:hypothetical protein